jgi:ribose 5-phosphate isomerase B
VRIGLGSDGIGLECKERLKARFAGQGHSAQDVCAADPCGSDYQNITDQLSSALYTGRVERGVLICSRAIGASVMANKNPGVRAALCHDLNSARQGVQDDGMNLLVIGAGIVSLDLACELADAFIEASHVSCEPAFGIPPRRLARVVEYIRSNLDQPPKPVTSVEFGAIRIQRRLSRRNAGLPDRCVQWKYVLDVHELPRYGQCCADELGEIHSALEMPCGRCPAKTP